MCGIAGIFLFKGNHSVIDESNLIKMRDTMTHRGPDGAGVWISPEGKIGLAHRRLSIIDLSEKAAQPMSNHDHTLWITFNGEIYNHAQIRQELQSISSRPWKTDHSDTEVILHAFEEWGIDCLHKLRGMFAFAIWDAKKRELWLVRDRIGIKPLYYSIHHGKLTFASEIKALLHDPQQKREVNEEALYHYLSFLTTPAPQTLFDGIKKLPGGTWLRIQEDGTIREHRYWDVWDFTQPMNDETENDIVEKIYAELKEAVQLRKISDVPVGVFLSGGIDSSTNAALFSDHGTSRVKTFSIGYHGEYQSYTNELHHAQSVADFLGTSHQERVLTLDDLLDFLPQMIRLQDEPIADPVCIPVYYVSKLARDNGVIVCQVGEGADELFWGYPGWKTMHQLQQWCQLPIPSFFKNFCLKGLEFSGKHMGRKYELLRRDALQQPVFWGGAEAFSDQEKKTLLSPRLASRFANYTSWEALRPIYESFRQKAWEKKPLQWMSYLDLNLRLPELLLMRVDKMSMGVSLEGRVPFLDHKLVELAMSIPESMKTKNGQLKYLLKKAVQGIIPDEIIHRKKQGFGVPVHEWFFDRLGQNIRQEMYEFCKKTDFLSPQGVAQCLEKGNGPQCWYLYNFALWWKEYIAH